MIHTAGLADGEALNLDFHAVMHGRRPGPGEALRAPPLPSAPATPPSPKPSPNSPPAPAHTLCAALRHRLPGYHATPDTPQRRFLNTGGTILNRGPEIVIRLNLRTYSLVLRQASLPETITVPWSGGRTLRYEYH